MGIIKQVELGRTFSQKLGESPRAQIRIGWVLDGPVGTQQLIGSGYFHGAPHPEYSFLVCTDGTVTESNAFSAEGTYTFELPQEGGVGFEANPLSRPDVWSYSTTSLSVPTFRWFDEETVQPLVNTAGDLIEGAQSSEGELRASVSGNRTSFPLATAVAVTGCVNSNPFAGGAAGHWLCNGISAQQTSESVNGFEVRYWQVTAELSFRQSGYDLFLPNVGWNYLDNGKKVRAFVTDKNGDEVASSNVVALDADGKMLSPTSPIIILQRRVNRAVDFSAFFGNPPQ